MRLAIPHGSGTGRASVRTSAWLGVLLWLGSLSTAAQEPAQLAPQPPASPKVLLPLKERQKSVVLQRQRVRQYSAPSSTAWDTLHSLVKSLGLRAEKVDPKSQLLVTSWQRVSKQKGNGLEPISFEGGGAVDEFQLHLFVSPFVEPARIYVDAVGRGHGTGDQVLVQYSFEPVARWFFGHLEERLGDEGRAVPFNADSSCVPSASVPGARPIQEPSALYEPQPLFPSKERARAGPVKVRVEATLGEDGAIRQVRVDHASEDGQMTAAAANAVALWRYSPVRFRGCPMPSLMTVTVAFRHQ